MESILHIGIIDTEKAFLFVLGLPEKDSLAVDNPLYIAIAAV
jgi:hypothetical protein